MPRQNVIAKQAIGITEFAIPTSDSEPDSIAAGPDGNLWFTEVRGNNIGRITPSGVVTEFAIPTKGALRRIDTGLTESSDIVAGPDGNLWFTEKIANQIGRITPNGTITEFALPTKGTSLCHIAAGPDGNLWFTYADHIGRITPNGVITEFGLPSGIEPNGIAAGADGNLWFTDSGHIGRITPSGVVSELVPTNSDSEPAGIAAGPDGNLWFTTTYGYTVGRITASGVVTEFARDSDSDVDIPLPADCIAAAPDGNLWFDWNGHQAKIGRITPSGVVTEFVLPGGGGPSGIAAGPDGNLWFTEKGANKIVRVTL